MKYYTYKKNIVVLLILCFIIILASILNFASKSTIGSIHTSVSSIVIYFAYRMLFLYFLFFSVYAYMSGVKGVRKLEAPIVLSILGALLVIVSFGPPIYGYFLASDVNLEVLNKVNLVEAKREALNIDNVSGRRYLLAEEYYLNTGERITFLNEYNKETIYAPSDRIIKLRDDLIKSRHQLSLAKFNLKITALGLLIILSLSCIIFFYFIWYKFKNKTITGQSK